MIGCSNLQAVFEKIFDALSKKSAAARVEGGEVVEGQDEFSLPTFRWDDAVSFDERIAIACRYYVKLRRQGAFDGIQESHQASDRRLLLDLLLHKLEHAGTLAKEYDESETRVVFWRNDGAAPSDGQNMISLDMEERSEKSAVHIFKFNRTQHETLEGQRSRIFHLYGALPKLDFAQQITHAGRLMYATAGVTPHYRDRCEDGITGKAHGHFQVLDKLPVGMREKLFVQPEHARPSLREFVGYVHKKTHQNRNLTKEVLVTALELPVDEVRKVEDELIHTVTKMRNRDCGEEEGGGEAFRGGSAWS